MKQKQNQYLQTQLRIVRMYDKLLDQFDKVNNKPRQKRRIRMKPIIKPIIIPNITSTEEKLSIDII